MDATDQPLGSDCDGLDSLEAPVDVIELVGGWRVEEVLLADRRGITGPAWTPYRLVFEDAGTHRILGIRLTAAQCRDLETDLHFLRSDEGS